MKNKLNYEVNWDEQTNGYVAVCHDIPLLAAWNSNPSEALNTLLRMIEEETDGEKPYQDPLYTGYSGFDW